jgi:hypothetical protein
MAKITGLKGVPPGSTLSLVVLRKGAAGSCALNEKSSMVEAAAKSMELHGPLPPPLFFVFVF